ncbi:hypothetical protein MARILYN_37 [Vibrio phage Marilyn]|nr:hypothetical protein MARILYN_37 [Vibrio phage Marilyn]WCD55560.1 hypothetical protein FAYDEN_37 [Vibrio phage Fayden]WCD55617.1 hypothetical protein BAYBAE_37 [Vibrio phage Baybae]WCD55676.1 hypothetical protein VAITEPHAGE_37 [Vibrio phage Vaitephage]
MLDLEKIAIEAVKNTLNSDALKESLEKKIEETITSELQNQFRSYSDFGKAFEKAIKDQMKIDLDNIGFTEYNHYVATTIKQKFSERINKPTENQIENMVNEVMTLESDVVTLESIIEKMRKGKEEYEHDSCGRFAFFATRGSDSWNNGKITFHYDDEEEGSFSTRSKRPSDCAFSFTISMETKKVIGFNLGSFGDTDTARVRTWRHDVESMFFRMYAIGSVIDLGDYEDSIMELAPGEEWDADDLDIDNCYPWYEG